MFECWKPPEDAVIIGNLDRSDREISRLLCAAGYARSKAAVSCRRLNLGRQKVAPDTWPDDVWQKTLAMHKQGYGPAYIARQLGMTRNMVCGKLNRNGLVSPRQPKVKKAYSPRAVAHKRPPEPPVPLGEIRGLRIADDGFGGCKWPLMGLGYELRMCCRVCVGTFCAEHADLAYNRPARALAQQGVAA